MKKILFSILLTAFGLWVTSCSEFFDVESESKLPENTMYETEGDAYRAVLGVYAVLSHNNVYGQQVSTYFPYNNDIEFAVTSASVETNRRGLWDYTVTSANSELNSFNHMYIAINRANECISGIEKSALFAASDPAAPSVIRHLLGEAKAIRALMYLELTRNWGDVPFKERETRYDDNFYPGPTSRDTILTHMIEDLIAVEPAMYYAGELTEKVERINRGAVQGLIARLALTRGGWSLRPNANDPTDIGRMYRPDDYMDYYRIANLYCRKLIDSGKHALLSSFRDVFYNQCQEIYPGNDDMLYEVALAMNYSGAIGHNLGVSISTNTKSPYGYSNIWYFVNLPYMYSFGEGDTRRDVSCTPYRWSWSDENNRLEQSVVDPINQMTIGKWSKLFMKTPQGYGAQYNTGINWPVIRYADVLLMYAETENEINNGPTDAAREALRTVRKRAFPSSFHAVMVDRYVAGLSGRDAFFEALVDERAWEFAGEGIRKYDLIRWNLLREKLIGLKKTFVEMGLDSRHPGNGGKYANVPAYIYSKKLADGTLDIVGLDQNMTGTPQGYTRHEWARKLVYDNDGTPNVNYDRYYRDFVLQKDPMVYIYPFQKDVVAESQGTLINYYGKQ